MMTTRYHLALAVFIVVTIGVSALQARKIQRILFIDKFGFVFELSTYKLEKRFLYAIWFAPVGYLQKQSAIEDDKRVEIPAMTHFDNPAIMVVWSVTEGDRLAETGVMTRSDNPAFMVVWSVIEGGKLAETVAMILIENHVPGKLSSIPGIPGNCSTSSSSTNQIWSA